MIRRRTTILATVLASLVAGAVAEGPAPAAAQDADPTMYERRVGEHLFIPSGFVEDPFVTTHVRTATGGGLATDFAGDSIVVAGQSSGALTGDIAFVVLDFEYQQNLFRRASLRAAVSGAARAGIDEESAVSQGITAIYGGSFEGKYRLYRNDRFYVSLNALWRRSNLFGIVPVNLANAVADSSFSGDNDLVREEDTDRLMGGVGGAYAPVRWLGFTSILRYGIVQPFEDAAKRKGTFRGSVLASVDVGRLSRVPIGFTVAFSYDSFPENPDDVSNGLSTLGLGVAYTGEEDFSIGLEVTNAKIKIRNADTDPRATQAQFNLRYYF